MLVPFRLARSALPAVALTVVLSLAAYGEGDGSRSGPQEAEAARSAGDLRAIKRYLLDHTERLKRNTAEIRRGAEAYYRLAKAANFDYERLSGRSGVGSGSSSRRRRPLSGGRTRAPRRWKVSSRAYPSSPTTT